MHLKQYFLFLNALSLHILFLFSFFVFSTIFIFSSFHLVSYRIVCIVHFFKKRHFTCCFWTGSVSYSFPIYMIILPLWLLSSCNVLASKCSHMNYCRTQLTDFKSLMGHDSASADSRQDRRTAIKWSQISEKTSSNIQTTYIWKWIEDILFKSKTWKARTRWVMKIFPQNPQTKKKREIREGKQERQYFFRNIVRKARTILVKAKILTEEGRKDLNVVNIIIITIRNCWKNKTYNQEINKD